jgi:hypothetical protein
MSSYLVLFGVLFFYFWRVTSKDGRFVIIDPFFFSFNFSLLPYKINSDPYCCWCFRFSPFGFYFLIFDFCYFPFCSSFICFQFNHSILICKCKFFNSVFLLVIPYFFPLLFCQSFYGFQFYLSYHVFEFFFNKNNTNFNFVLFLLIFFHLSFYQSFYGLYFYPLNHVNVFLLFQQQQQQ